MYIYIIYLDHSELMRKERYILSVHLLDTDRLPLLLQFSVLFVLTVQDRETFRFQFPS